MSQSIKLTVVSANTVKASHVQTAPALTGVVAGGNTNVDKNFVHVQQVPQAIWMIEHDLGKYPSVAIVDSAGENVVGEVFYINNNTVEIRFTNAFAGKAFFN